MAIANAISDSEDAVGSVIPYAVSIELLQNYSQIHEDVEDGNTEHNGRPSVWWTWGPAQAINAGDGMHAMARMALFALSEKGEPVESVSASLKALDQAAVLMCEGEYVDITMQEQIGLTSQKYIDMVRARSGALFGASAQIACIAVGKPDMADTLQEFGQHAGTARQLVSDYTLFWGGEQLDSVQQGRLLTKKKNLPVVHAIESAPPTTKRQLGDIYVQRVIDPNKISEITSLLDQSGSAEFTLKSVDEQLQKANAALDGVDLDDRAKARLGDLLTAIAGFEEGSSQPVGSESS